MMNQLLPFFLFFSFTIFGQSNSNDSVYISLDDPFISTLDSNVIKVKKKKESIFDLISKEEVFEMTLEANFDSIILYKKILTEYLPGKVSFKNDDMENVDLKVEIKPRGKYRRMICDFPPLRLKFKKKGLKKLGLTRKYNSLKLVSHCLSNKKDAKENILKEYLIYKMYNLHSEYSLRAQLVKIKYVQSGSGKKLFSRLAILLEEDDELAKRTNSTVVEKKHCSADSIAINSGTTQAMFQFMIGNADWSLTHMRNVKVLRPEYSKKLYVFPYDFDFSGLVEADYAIPNPDYKLKSIKQRVFLGRMPSEEEMKEVATHFLNQKENSIQLCKGFKMLPRRCRKEMVKYLKSFYEIIEDHEQMAAELSKLCPKK